MKYFKLLKKDKRGVFGLTSVQQFFAIILGVALLAYVIVVIMGTLNDSTLLTGNALAQTVVNESGWVNSTGFALTNSSASGIRGKTIIAIINGSSGTVLSAAQFSLDPVTKVVTNGTVLAFFSANITWSYLYNSQVEDNAANILNNVSEGVTSFFSSINPVYAILAILVIILILIVLVRVVTGGTASGGDRRSTGPQL